MDLYPQSSVVILQYSSVSFSKPDLTHGGTASMKSTVRSHRFFQSLALALLVTPTLLSAQTANKPNAASSTTLTNVYVTLYGWYDNSPAGNGIAYPANAGFPTIHNVAT